MHLPEYVSQLVSVYGYWAVLGLAALESMGVPAPAETMLIGTAIYAAHTHDMSLALLVAFAAAGAILGDNIGYWIGRRFGYRLLVRYGRYVRLTEPRIKLGQYLFLRYGSRIVFFGRFVAEVRTFAALLAGVNRMPWRRFLIANAAGGSVWATLWGVGGWELGDRLDRLMGPLGIAIGICAAIAVLALIFTVHRHLARLQAEADKAFPGPLKPK